MNLPGKKHKNTQKKNFTIHFMPNDLVGKVFILYHSKAIFYHLSSPIALILLYIRRIPYVFNIHTYRISTTLTHTTP